MTQKSLPQHASLKQPFGWAPPVIHCPVCGHAPLAHAEETGDPEPCPHLAFIYLGCVGEYMYQSDDFSRRMEEHELEDADLDAFAKMLAQAGYDNQMLALEITYGGVACGPVWYTDIYGFDFGASERTGAEEV